MDAKLIAIEHDDSKVLKARWTATGLPGTMALFGRNRFDATDSVKAAMGLLNSIPTAQCWGTSLAVHDSL